MTAKPEISRVTRSEDVNRSMKLIRPNANGCFLEVEEIAERERPPMIEVPEYLDRTR